MPHPFFTVPEAAEEVKLILARMSIDDAIKAMWVERYKLPRKSKHRVAHRMECLYHMLDARKREAESAAYQQQRREEARAARVLRVALALIERINDLAELQELAEALGERHAAVRQDAMEKAHAAGQFADMNKLAKTELQFNNER